VLAAIDQVQVDRGVELLRERRPLPFFSDLLGVKFFATSASRRDSTIRDAAAGWAVEPDEIR
jgi:hypothetical protein